MKNIDSKRQKKNEEYHLILNDKIEKFEILIENKIAKLEKIVSIELELINQCLKEGNLLKVIYLCKMELGII